MSNKIVEFGEIKKRSLDSVGGLTELRGKTLLITDVEFQEMGSLGEVAVVTVEYTERGKKRIEKRHTFSKVLISQLKAVKEYIEQGMKVQAKLTKRRNYYTFE